MIVTSYDVMTFAHDCALASHGFRACDSFERMIEFISLDRLKG